MGFELSAAERVGELGASYVLRPFPGVGEIDFFQGIEINKNVDGFPDFEVHDPVCNCPFCEMPKSDWPFGYTQSLGDGTLGLTPALGMIVPGYFVTFTNRHITSMAQLSDRELNHAGEIIDLHAEHLSQGFGEYSVIEHGSDGLEERGTGACLVHAHQHMIPGRDIGEHILSQLNWQEIKDFQSLRELRGTPYMYIGFDGQHYVVEDPNVPSQWARRQVQAVRPEIEEWDWAIYNGAKELWETYARLGRWPHASMYFNFDLDSVVAEHKTTHRKFWHYLQQMN